MTAEMLASPRGFGPARSAHPDLLGTIGQLVLISAEVAAQTLHGLDDRVDETTVSAHRRADA
jgi:hypothetical protein